MSRFRYLHLEQAIPLLGMVNVPDLVTIIVRFKKAMDQAKGRNPDAKAPEVMEELGQEFIIEAVGFLTKTDMKVVRKLAMIAMLDINALEKVVDDDKAEADEMRKIGRMEIVEVFANVLFFIGVRTNTERNAPSSSQTEEVQTGEALQATSDSSVGL